MKSEKIPDVIEMVSRKLEDGFSVISMVALFVMMILITANAVGRYVINRPIAGVYESTELYLMVIVVFFSAAALQRQDGNVSVDIFSKRYPKRVDQVKSVVAKVIGFVIFGAIAHFAIKRTIQGIQEGWVLTGVYAFPVYVSWGIMAAGLTLLSIRLLIQIGEDLAPVFTIVVQRLRGDT